MNIKVKDKSIIISISKLQHYLLNLASEAFNQIPHTQFTGKLSKSKVLLPYPENYLLCQNLVEIMLPI